MMIVYDILTNLKHWACCLLVNQGELTIKQI